MVTSNDARRLFLQAIISRRFLSTELAKTLWKKSVETIKAVDENLEVPSTRDAGWEDFVNEINDSLNSLDLEFSRVHEEETGKEMWALVNRRDDEIAQMATDYSAVEISYFKALVEEIMLAVNHSYSVSSIAAMRENPKPSGMSKTQAEAVLTSFVARGWLLRSKKGRYSLSTRTLLELQPYLKSTFPDDILECTICLEILTKGIHCYTSNCNIHMHSYCYEKYKAKNTKCPSCSSDWAKEANVRKLVAVGEKAAGPDDGRRRRRSTVEGSDNEGEGASFEEANEEDAEEATPTQANGKRSSHRASTRATSAASQVDASMEVDEEEEAPRKRGGRRRG